MHLTLVFGSSRRLHDRFERLQENRMAGRDIARVVQRTKLLAGVDGVEGGAKSGEAFVQLYLYAKRVGGKADDSSTGFAIGPELRPMSPLKSSREQTIDVSR